MDSDKSGPRTDGLGREARGGVCGGSRPTLVVRDGRLVFAGSGRALDDVIAALERGDQVDPDEARIAIAEIERRG